MKKVISICFGLIGGIFLNAQTVTLELEGNIIEINDINNNLKSDIKTGDSLSAKIIYYTDIPDDNLDSTVGDYHYTNAPAGFYIKIDSLNFQTDTNDIDFLVESVCRSSCNGGNAIGFISYNNLFDVGNDFMQKSIDWQLEDIFGKSLLNDSLIHKIDLNQFEQSYGITIMALSDSGYLNFYMIRALFTKIISTVRDVDNNIIDIDTSILLNNSIIINADTTGEIVEDYNGNLYKTVKIGTQTWLKENLKSLNYSDGKPIENTSVYNNNEEYGEIYGRLYTWNAAMNGSSGSSKNSGGVQGVCPSGWHLPNSNEWYTLIRYLGGNSEAGTKMKEKGTAYWESPNEGADNSSFLTIRPGGSKQSENYIGVGEVAAFWTTDGCNEVYAQYAFLDNNTTRAIIYNDGNKTDNLSIRCIKDDYISSDTSNTTNSEIRIEKNIYLDVFPNPASEKIYINGLSKQVIILIIDLNSKIVLKQQYFKNPIDIQKLKSGIYFIKILDDNGVAIKKFIKQ